MVCLTYVFVGTFVNFWSHSWNNCFFLCCIKMNQCFFCAFRWKHCFFFELSVFETTQKEKRPLQKKTKFHVNAQKRWVNQTPKKKYGWIKSNKMDKGFFLYLHVDERIVFLNLTSLKQLWKKTVTSKKNFHLSEKNHCHQLNTAKKKSMVELNTTKNNVFFCLH